MQSAVMWDDARAIVVMDEQGRTVLRGRPLSTPGRTSAPLW